MTNLTRPLAVDDDLMTCFQRISDLIPNYDWNCYYNPRTGDLRHIPTNVLLSCDINGYELTKPTSIARRGINDASLCLYFDDEPHTVDPRTAVQQFVVEVIRALAEQRIMGNM